VPPAIPDELFRQHMFDVFHTHGLVQHELLVFSGSPANAPVDQALGVSDINYERFQTARDNPVAPLSQRFHQHSYHSAPACP